MQIWNKLLDIECPQRIVEEWQNIVKELVKSRIYADVSLSTIYKMCLLLLTEIEYFSLKYRTHALLSACAYISTRREYALTSELRLIRSSA